MDILEWAQSQNFDNNHMVRKLAGKTQFDGPNELDLELAKRTVQDRFIVGLIDEFEESIHRFNAVMGIDESEKQGRCMKRFFVKDKKSNTNPHPKVSAQTPRPRSRGGCAAVRGDGLGRRPPIVYQRWEAKNWKGGGATRGRMNVFPVFPLNSFLPT